MCARMKPVKYQPPQRDALVVFKRQETREMYLSTLRREQARIPPTDLSKLEWGAPV